MSKEFEQLTFIPGAKSGYQLSDEAKKLKNFSLKFQRWSDKNHQDSTTPDGKCAYMNCCNYCDDRNLEKKAPCASALRKMIKEKKIKINFSKSFEEILAELDY